MRNQALMFFGGILTAAAVQFVTQREWRPQVGSEVRADEVAYGANSEGAEENGRLEGDRGPRGRHRMQDADMASRERPRGRRDWQNDERGEDQNVSRNEDQDENGHNVGRAGRDRRDWRYAVEERPARDEAGPRWGEHHDLRDDREADHEAAWQHGPRGPEGRGPERAERRGRGPAWGPGPHQGEEFSGSFSTGRHSSSGSMSGPGFGPHFGPGPNFFGGRRFGGRDHFEFASHEHHRSHHHWAGQHRARHHGHHRGGWSRHGRGFGWAAAGRTHHRHHHHGGGWHHRRAQGRGFARHGMHGRGSGFGHHGSWHGGFAHHSFGRHGFEHHGFGRHGGRRGHGFAFHRGGHRTRGHHGRFGGRGFTRMAGANAHARFDAFFAAADANKDGKLTKDELANFMWKRFGKADANGDQAITKEEMQKFFRQRITALRAERPGRRHKPHADATKPKKTEPAKPKPAPASTAPKSEPKAEAKPAPKSPTAAAQAMPSTAPAADPAKPTQAGNPKTGEMSKTGRVSKAEAKQPSVPNNTGLKIGTSTTSGEVSAALFAARR
jgi:hypothetical protein